MGLNRPTQDDNYCNLGSREIFRSSIISLRGWARDPPLAEKKAHQGDACGGRKPLRFVLELCPKTFSPPTGVPLMSCFLG